MTNSTKMCSFIFRGSYPFWGGRDLGCGLGTEVPAGTCSNDRVLVGGVTLCVLVTSTAVTDPNPNIVLDVAGSLARNQGGATCKVLNVSLKVLNITVISTADVNLIVTASGGVFLTVRLINTVCVFCLNFGVTFKGEGSFILSSNGALSIDDADTNELFGRNLLASLSGPGPVLFFVTMFPRFVSARRACLSRFLVLTSTFYLLILLVRFYCTRTFTLTDQCL